MKKMFLFLFASLLILTGCSAKGVLELSPLLKKEITFEAAIQLVQASEKTGTTPVASMNEMVRLSTSKLDSSSEYEDPVVQYFLNRYQSVTVTYEITTKEGTEKLNFEIRAEVFLNAIYNNEVSITSSMPKINYLYVSTYQLEALEAENVRWKGSNEALIAPFKNKYKYGETIDHFGIEIKDFTSTGGGMVTTETSNEFSFSATDNRLIKWQFQFYNKDETTAGTNVVYKTIEVDFNWKLKD